MESNTNFRFDPYSIIHTTSVPEWFVCFTYVKDIWGGLMKHFVSAKTLFVSKHHDIANASITPPLSANSRLAKPYKV